MTPARRDDVAAVAALLADQAGHLARGQRRVGHRVGRGRERQAAAEIVRELDAASIELAEFALRKASLDEVFLALTGQPASPASPGRPDETAQPDDTSKTPELNGSTR